MHFFTALTKSHISLRSCIPSSWSLQSSLCLYCCHMSVSQQCQHPNLCVLSFLSSPSPGSALLCPAFIYFPSVSILTICTSLCAAHRTVFSADVIHISLIGFLTEKTNCTIISQNIQHIPCCICRSSIFFIAHTVNVIVCLRLLHTRGELSLCLLWLIYINRPIHIGKLLPMDHNVICNSSREGVIFSNEKCVRLNPHCEHGLVNHPQYWRRKAPRAVSASEARYFVRTVGWKQKASKGKQVSITKWHNVGYRPLCRCWMSQMCLSVLKTVQISSFWSSKPFYFSLNE